MYPHDHTAGIIDQVVVVVPQPGGCATLVSREDKRPIGGERRPKGCISEDARAAMSAALRFRWNEKKRLAG